jgi:hypothetical protein
VEVVGIEFATPQSQPCNRSEVSPAAPLIGGSAYFGAVFKFSY